MTPDPICCPIFVRDGIMRSAVWNSLVCLLGLVQLARGEPPTPSSDASSEPTSTTAGTSPLESDDESYPPLPDSSAVLNARVFPSTGDSPASRFYVDGEYLVWWIKDAPVPTPLVTSGMAGGGGLPGVLGQAGTIVVLGERGTDSGSHSGARFTVGHWIDQDQWLAVEGSYFFLPQQSTLQTVGTLGLPGSPNLAVPIFDVSGVTSFGSPGETIFVLPRPLPGPSGSVVPGFSGQFSLATTSRLQGAELNGILNLSRPTAYSNGPWVWDGLAGFRWVQLAEELDFNVQTVGVPAAAFPFAGQYFNSRDTFRSENDFFGGQGGLESVTSLARRTCWRPPKSL